jgi:hypothetical protein
MGMLKKAWFRNGTASAVPQAPLNRAALAAEGSSSTPQNQVVKAKMLELNW